MRRIIKVLLIMPLPPSTGGMTSVTEHILSFFKAHPGGINLMICDTSHHIRPATSESVPVRLFTGFINSLNIYLKVKKLIKKNTPDVIHLASSSSLSLIKDSLIVKAARHAKIPVIVHWHFGRIPDLRVKQNWEWKKLFNLVQKSSRSIVIDRKSLETLMEVGCTNVVYIPNPLSKEIEKKAREISADPRQREQGRIIYVGNIIRNKGAFDLVEACAQIPSVKELILIGPYEEAVKNELIKISQTRKDREWLKFSGRLNMGQVLEYMSHSPVLALPSYTEGFPMVIVEAMAMGCAVIASDVGAIPEMLAIESKRPCGICIPAGDIEKLKEAIMTLLNNHSMIEKMGVRGIKRVLANYNSEKVARQYRLGWKTLVN
ncbi:MAG: glycosyltransferase family 4 protein [Mangrovibacterium sp.]